MNLRPALFTCIAISSLIGCSEGVSVDSTLSTPTHVGPTVSADAALTGTQAALAINDPINSVNEPFAEDWLGAGEQSRHTNCADDIQYADEAFATGSFERVHSEDGNYLVSSLAAHGYGAEYIEFCFNVPELGRYQFVADVRAPSPNKDSYYVTVNEDAPGSVPNPGIYDVSRSDQFKFDLINTRTQDPLISILERGTVTLRLYYREPDTAIRSLRLEANVQDVPAFDPEVAGVSALAQCAINTGMSEVEIDTYIDQHLGDVPRRFVLTPADEESGFGFDRNDYQWLTDEGIGNIMCLAPPPARPGSYNLIDNTVPAGRIVFGSQGRDEQRSNTPLLGTFFGNGGDDAIGTLEDGGVFFGGAGNDKLTSMLGGLFDGGAGNDVVIGIQRGTFNGGAGNDQVTNLMGGLFDGGEGFDRIERVSEFARYVSVEEVVISFSELLPPTNAQFVDSTPLNTVITWTASPDDRVDGYVISELGERDVDFLIDLGLPPIDIGRFQTYGTAVEVHRFNTQERVLQIRAYREVADDNFVENKFLYSEPLQTVYIPPAAPTESIIASREVSFTPLSLGYDGAELAEDESVVQINGFGTTPFTNLGTSLEANTNIVYENLLSNRRNYNGVTRQYIVSGNRTEIDGAQVTAFSGDGLSVLWEQTLDNSNGFDDSSDCRTGVITQDDWLVCIPFNGAVAAFDPNGMLYSYRDARFDITSIADYLLDGDIGRLIKWERGQNTYTSMNLFSGVQFNQTTDLDAFMPGDGEWYVNALALHVDQLILAGAQEFACIDPPQSSSCILRGNSAEHFFIARIDMSSGQVQRFVTQPIESRPVPDRKFPLPNRFGQIINDTVVFGFDNFVTSYDLDTLEEIDRQVVIGVVQDVSENRVLSRQGLFDEDDFLIGYELFLNQR